MRVLNHILTAFDVNSVLGRLINSTWSDHKQFLPEAQTQSYAFFLAKCYPLNKLALLRPLLVLPSVQAP